MKSRLAGALLATVITLVISAATALPAAAATSGRIVEIPNQPGDPTNVSRDDLVYPVGTMHLVNTTVGIVSPTLNPHNCLFGVTLQEDSQIIGGTGLFAHASGTFTGTISPQGLLPHNPDGSCAAIGTPSLHEVDMVAFSGTLSF